MCLASPSGLHERRERRYILGSQTVDVAALTPGLHIVATPIGNLGDITLRALPALAGADLIACEDTRVTRKLLDRYAIATPLTPYHDHNAAKARPALLRRLARGAAIALVSDAGTPLVSRPGIKARAGGAGRRTCRHRASRRFGAARGVERRRPAHRSILVRRLSPAQTGRPARAHRRTRRHPSEPGAVRDRAADRGNARRSRGRARPARRPRFAASLPKSTRRSGAASSRRWRKNTPAAKRAARSFSSSARRRRRNGPALPRWMRCCGKRWRARR